MYNLVDLFVYGYLLPLAYCNGLSYCFRNKIIRGGFALQYATERLDAERSTGKRPKYKKYIQLIPGFCILSGIAVTLLMVADTVLTAVLLYLTRKNDE